jgi:DNA-binding GntR family transcriptional regulator
MHYMATPANAASPVTDRDIDSDVAGGVEQVYRELRTLILEGAIEPGAVVSQVSLASRLGVSRTPLREALRLLQHEGLIENAQRRRPRITPIEPAAIDALYAERISTEALGVTLTVPLLQKSDLDAIMSALSDMCTFTTNHQLDGWQASHLRFHQLLVIHAGPHLGANIASAAQRSQRYIRLCPQAQQAWSASQPEHAAIAEACLQGDAVLAANLLARHLARSALSILAANAPEYEPRAVRAALRLIGIPPVR